MPNIKNMMTKIKIEKQHLIILAVLVLSAAVFSVIQLTTASPAVPNPGHAWSEIEKPADCPPGQYVYGLGSNLLCGTPGVAFGDLKRYVFNALPAAFLSIIQPVFASPAAPNPGHTWDQIEKPANCPSGQYVYGLGSSLLCSTPAGASPQVQVIWENVENMITPGPFGAANTVTFDTTSVSPTANYVICSAGFRPTMAGIICRVEFYYQGPFWFQAGGFSYYRSSVRSASGGGELKVVGVASGTVGEWCNTYFSCYLVTQ